MDDVAKYYESNTRRFLRFGRGGDEGAIHREVWGPGTVSRSDAMRYINKLVIDALADLVQKRSGRTRIADLGCGVGGTATDVARALDVQVLGITNSFLQARLASQRAGAARLQGRVQFIKADYLYLPIARRFGGAYAIESFLHAPDARRFFRELSDHVIEGGRLIVCDDFLSEPNGDSTCTRREKWLRRFRKGWHAKSLLPVQQVCDIAAGYGFRCLEKTDLTPYLRPYYHPVVLALLKAVTTLPLSFPFWENLSGGTAIQVCLRKSWVKYYFLVFEKVEP